MVIASCAGPDFVAKLVASQDLEQEDPCQFLGGHLFSVCVSPSCVKHCNTELIHNYV